MNLTDLLATPLIHLPTATRRGVVVGFAIDERLRRISHVVMVDEDSYCREIYYRWRDLRWGECALLTTAEGCEDGPTRIPFRETVLDADGKDYGYLKEVVCDERGHIEYLLTTKDERLEAARLLRVGDVVLTRGQKRLVLSTRHGKAAQSAPSRTNAQEASAAADEAKTEQPLERAEYVVEEPKTSPKTAETMPEDSASPDETAQEPQPIAMPIAADEEDGTPYREEEIGALRRVAGDYTFLLGREMKGDLVDKGQLLIAAGTVITPDHVELARRHGLLLPLTLLSR